MKKHSAIAFSLVLTAAFAQSPNNSDAPAFDRLVDRAITQETTLLKILRGEHPVAETYIQDMGPDPDFGAVPIADHYFLGKLDLSRGVTTESFIPKSKAASGVGSLGAFSRLFAAQYLPRGFAQMLLIDGAQFDR